jgi:serine/threonine protein kinase
VECDPSLFASGDCAKRENVARPLSPVIHSKVSQEVAMESEEAHSHLEPVDARQALALYLELLERGKEIPFEHFCERFPQWKGELAGLYRGWQQVSQVLGKWAGYRSLSARLAWRYGPEGLRDLGLERESTPAPEDVFEVLFRRLRIKREGFGRYRIKDEVGHGGMGIVLRVWDDELKRHLAMKLIRGGEGTPDDVVADASTVGRFLDEAQVTAQLEHPGIVPVHELGLDMQGNLYFTMRLVKGRNLGEVFELVRAGRTEEWNQTRALGVLLRACEALAYAHSKGVIHRDLKPSNIMVGPFGEVYVMDWGLAKVVAVEDRALAVLEESVDREDIQSERRSASGTPGSPHLTQGGHALGTPAYMSPEQARGDLAAMGPQSDVYSMGAILYHLLTGQMPYTKRRRDLEAHQVLAKVMQGPPEPIQLAADRTAELVAICAKAMARRAEDRYPTVVELANDLRAYLERRVVKAYRSGRLVTLSKWAERNRALAIALVACCALSCAIGVAFMLKRHEALRREAMENFVERVETAVRVAPSGLGSSELLEILDRERVWLWWACQYKDGTIVYNRFRSYRTHSEIEAYFRGKARAPDDDAFVIKGEQVVHIAFDRKGADQMIQLHGSIVRIDRVPRPSSGP